MAFNATAAYGMYEQDIALNNVMRALNQAGFDNEDICMMLSPSHPIAAMVRDASLFTAERASNSVTEKLIGWISGFGAVLIPTVGFFIRSQAFFHALMVAQDAPAIRGNSSTLAGLGFPEDDADRFESQLRKVGAMVYVSCKESARTEWACEVLRHTGAQETATLHSQLATAGAAA